MMQVLSFNDMNQAVPGSLLSPRMEQQRHFECEVPSPSQWSDTCRSPPSLHSPIHYPSEIEKVKEEPYSPPQVFSQYHMSKDSTSNEASFDLADLLSENSSSLHNQVQPQQAIQQPATLYEQRLQVPVYQQRVEEHYQQDIQQQTTSIAYLHQQSPHQDIRVKVENEFREYFLENNPTIEIKKEVDEEGRYVVSSTTPAVTSSIPFQEPLSVTIPTSVPNTISKDDETKVDFALDLALAHYMQAAETVSSKLNIPEDPIAWSIADVKSWLEFQAKERKMPALSLDHWNYSGVDLAQMTEAQFRKLIPQGGEVLYAIIEIYRAGIGSRNPTSNSSNVQSTAPLQQYQDISSPVQQPLSVNVQDHGTQQYFNVPQMYQSPTHSQGSMFSPNKMMMSPPNPPQTPVQLSPAPSQQPASPSMKLPTTVLQAERQQKLKRQNLERSPSTSSLGPNKKPRSQSPSYQMTNTSTYLDESFIDMTTLLQENSSTATPASLPQPTTTTVEPADVADSDDEAPAEATSSITPTPSGRSGTHIHLWQFLKELLMQPRYLPFIRWVDRNAGIFKIEDSVQVAKLWGKRKNRPAMNYDKLSRSIRQYYKKGIMKKTERSQRLVYQFCHPYGL